MTQDAGHVDDTKHSTSINTLTKSHIPYDRQKVTPGILHIGAGRFHRAHQALYCHELLANGDLRWGISAAYILKSDQPTIEAMKHQECLYSLIERDEKGETPKVIGSIVEVLDGYNSPQDVVNRIADPAIKLITFTVTESGYFFDPSTKQLLIDHPLIQADVGATEAPQTLYGFLALGLEQRRRNGLGPVTIQSCDNIQGNGNLMQTIFLEFLSIWDKQNNKDLQAWVANHVTFPNSMVDRITPAADPAEQTHAKAILNFDDALAVTSETYRQWVIENNYCNDLPDWPSVGVQVVECVIPYEQMKIRLLNAGHTAIAYSGYLAGHETIGSIVKDPSFQTYLVHFFEEVEQTLPELPDFDVKAYQSTLIERFMNPAIVDQALRICKDGSAKIPGFVIPTLNELLAKGHPTKTFSFLLASYHVFLSRQLANHGVAGIDDTQAPRLAQLIEQTDVNITAFLSDEALFGKLTQYSSFVSDCQHMLDTISANGISQALPTR